MIDCGIIKPGATVRIPWGSYDGATGASEAASNFADADILVYKDGSTTQRSSASGITATTSFDSASLTGINLIEISLADNTDAGFYAAGSEYLVLVGPVTVDTQTVYFAAGRFRIGLSNAVLATTIATLASQTSFTLTAGPAEDDALNGCIVYIHDVASAVQGGYAQVLDYTGASKTVTLAAGTTFTAAATDNIMVFPPALLPAGAVPYAVAGAAGGLFIAGTNAPVTITGSGDALTLTSTGANGNGIKSTGNGSGDGLELNGGATGHGLHSIGGATSGHGASLNGQTDGNGLYALGHGTGDGIAAEGFQGLTGLATSANGAGANFTGNGAGAGLQCDAGATGNGLAAAGGATSGDGLHAQAGASGQGINAIGGATDGSGLRAAGPTSGNGIYAEANGIDQSGITAYAVGGGNAAGIEANGGTDGPGFWAYGNAAAAGVRADGGATGVGAAFTGGATSGAGATFLATAGNSDGITATKQGSGKDINATLLAVTTALNLTTNNDKTGYTLSAAGVQAIWDALTSALSAVGSIGKLIVDNLNATITSRMATFTLPTNFSALSITAGGLVDITQAAADKVWGTASRTLTSFGTLVADVATAVWGAATRILTAGTNIVLAKGVGVTGFNDLSEANVRTALGMAAADLDTQLAAIAAQIAGLNNISQAQVLTQMNAALDTVLADSIPADGSRPSLRQAIYMGIQFLVEREVVGTTLTIKKVNGATALFTCTLNDATTPTAITRAT